MSGLSAPAATAQNSSARALEDTNALSTYTAIDAGGSANGNWVADRNYNGGAVATVGNSINTSQVSNPAPQSVYQTQRYGSVFTYTIPNFTPNRAYTVRLHLVESFFGGAGQRVFNVKINGASALTNFDIFAAAGGENIAVVKQFNSNANSAGKIAVQFSSVVNYASIAGIEIIGGSSTPTPMPSPTNTPKNGQFPIFSSRFTGQPSPFHETVTQLVSRGARLESGTLLGNLWAQGIESNTPANNGAGTATPIYLGESGNSSYTVSCSYYGTCNASGMRVHFPSGAAPQANSDHHIVSADTVLGGEFDGWQCGQSNLAGCGWGGWFPFSGNGLDKNSGNSANNAGYAFGIFTITAQELLNGRISHALGLIASCLDNPDIYPADTLRGTDTSCSGNGYPAPSAHYGDLLHLKASYNVGASGYSSTCKTILTALQTYGAYTVDTNNDGLVLEMEYGGVYSNPNPYYNTIYPNLAAGGDASGAGSGFAWKSCLQRLNSSDLELYAIGSGT